MKKFLLFLSVFMVGSLTSLGIVYAIQQTYPTFPDVDYDDYYGDSLKTMQERGVIEGYSNGDFGPNDAVTRAQLVTILDRYEVSLFNQNYPNKTTDILNLMCSGIDEEKFSTDQYVERLYAKYCFNNVTL